MSKTLALIGNPNVGKTAIFNEITGQTGQASPLRKRKTLFEIKEDGLYYLF